MLGRPDTKVVTLGKGNTVTLRETTGADEFLAIKILGKELNKEEEIAGGMQQIAVMIALSIVEINGNPQPVPQSTLDVTKVLAMFRSKDMGKIRNAFLELNGDEEDFLEEQTG